LFLRTVSSRLSLPTNLPGVHVDDPHRLGLLDDEVPAGLQPDLLLERSTHLVRDLVGVEDLLSLTVVHADLVDHLRADVRQVVADLLGELLGVDDEVGELRAEHVADHPHDEMRFLVDRIEGLHLLRLRLHLVPDAGETGDVGLELLLGRALRQRCAR
jgi:hypothetical protein